MRLTKSLLSVISVLALATGAAFAGEGWSSESSPYPMNGSESLSALEESDREYFA